MVNTSNNTERLRPDVAEGGSEEGLSFPQQLDRSEAVAVQKHQVTPVATQVKSDA
jgi:hypothetical protein